MNHDSGQQWTELKSDKRLEHVHVPILCLDRGAEGEIWGEPYRRLTYIPDSCLIFGKSRVGFTASSRLLTAFVANLVGKR